ncbi:MULTISPECIES: hypothetical protein [Vibrio]|uniref:hypothetical protein n=1 Tax=Vibrio TaxID=662 RepID=UPI001331C0BF|nr:MULTISPECIES: hypothetical protein [Vibrio]MDF5453500.1 hypothetical protein [Vibrio parahaemolyticus]NMS06417.1 hypothetical protein [Vibrio parahaemolyticus]
MNKILLNKSERYAFGKCKEQETETFYLTKPISDCYELISEDEEHYIINFILFDKREIRIYHSNVFVNKESGEIYDPESKILNHNECEKLNIGLQFFEYHYLNELDELVDLSDFESVDDIFDDYDDCWNEELTEKVWHLCQEEQDTILISAVAEIYKDITKNR